jgi:hypothetical protein
MKLASILTLLSLVVLPLGACTEAVPAVVEPAPEAPCCSLDDVLAMHAAGVDEDLIITSVQAGEPLTPTAQDLIKLSEAGVGKRVVQAMMGEEPASAAGSAEAEAGSSGKAAEGTKAAASHRKGPPPLDLAVLYTPGEKRFTLTNHGGRTLTGLVLTANDEYVYALPVPLPPGNPDGIRVSSFTSRGTGHRLHHAEGIKKLHITSDQGTWSKRW